MASSDDYIGLQFGSFIVEASIARGREAEVFGVLNRETGRKYVMRLDTDDDAMWEGHPVNPPTNFSLEAKNVRGSWFGTLHYEDGSRIKDASWWSKMRRIFKPNEPRFQVSVPRIFGVKDLTYLIPVSSPISLRGAISFETFLGLAPPDDLDLFETWEDVVLTMLGDAHATNSGKLSEATWNERWSVLLGGDILCRAVAKYMESGSLSHAERKAVLNRISRGDGQGREFAHNLLLRMCGAISRGRISLNAAKRTVRDRFFRENLTIRELNQIVSSWSILSRDGFINSNLSINILSELLSELKEQPPNRWDNPDLFEMAPDQDFGSFIEEHKLNRFTLFLQELALQQQNFATVTLEPTS